MSARDALTAELRAEVLALRMTCGRGCALPEVSPHGGRSTTPPAPPSGPPPRGRRGSTSG